MTHRRRFCVRTNHGPTVGIHESSSSPLVVVWSARIDQQTPYYLSQRHGGLELTPCYGVTYHKGLNTQSIACLASLIMYVSSLIRCLHASTIITCPRSGDEAVGPTAHRIGTSQLWAYQSALFVNLISFAASVLLPYDNEMTYLVLLFQNEI